MEALLPFLDIKSDNLLPKLLATMATAIFIILWIFFPSIQSRQPSDQKRSAISACKNPICVRCQRYRQVQKQAKTRLAWILRDLRGQDPEAVDKMHTRVMEAVKRGHHPPDNPWQNPTVLMVDNLRSQENVTHFHRAACEYLRNNPTREIVQRAVQCEALFVPWTVDDSPDGRWEVLQILNQGTWNSLLLKAEQDGIQPWKCLLDHTRNIPGLMNYCLFGNVMVSRICPGTTIEQHCGPTNVRHRLQVVIEMPALTSVEAINGRRNSMPVLDVGPHETLSWDAHNDIFVFDDSFVHSVSYPKDKEGGSDDADDNQRTVLIVDLWHPSLAPIERTLLQQLYPPFNTSSDSATRTGT